MTRQPIQVLVVEDSQSALLLLVHILDSDPAIKVVGTASEGGQALEFLKRARPDVILMDIHMSGMDGFEATRRIMETSPLPIIVCSASLDPAEVELTFRAMQAGAIAVLAKPAGFGHIDHESTAAKLVETVKLMAEVKVVKRWPRARVPGNFALPSVPVVSGAPNAIRLVAIGASTGGPPVLQTILAGLPADFSLPILIVQHIAAGFLPGMIEWLSHSTGFSIGIASHGEPLANRRAYFAPDGYHLGISSNWQIQLGKQPPDSGLRPSVAHLFQSVANVCGPAALAVLLSGMGKDGARELKQLRTLGAITVAQDQESSIVHGMPGEAIQLDAASFVLNPEKIIALLSSPEVTRGGLHGKRG